MKHTKEDLKIMQNWSLEAKIQRTQMLIMEWYEHFNGKVYISFSGGKDSTVLLDLARRMYSYFEAVFVDTGLEYPEIRDFVKSKDNVTWLKPKMRFDEAVKEYGWNFPSKDVAMTIYYARKGSRWAVNKLQGLNNDGTYSEFKQRYKKFAYLVDAPFKISNQCCLVMKEKPLRDYEKQNSVTPIMGTMADESRRRKESWLRSGCNAFESSHKSSQPLSFWTEQDILQYIRQFKISYSSVYGEIIENQGKLLVTGEQRTGCMFCPVGCHLDHSNKYQRMKITHPKQYDYCMNNLGLKEVLKYINVPFE